MQTKYDHNDSTLSVAHSRRLNRAAICLAEVSLMDSSASESQKEAALHLAQWAGVTTSEYIRARIFVEAAIASLARNSSKA
jgi:hypothetical protein